MSRHCEGKEFAWCDCPCAKGIKVPTIDDLGSVGDVCELCYEATASSTCICADGDTERGLSTCGFPCPVHPPQEI